MKTTIIRTSLVISLATACVVGGLNLSRLRERITGLQSDLQTQTGLRAKAESDLHGTRKEFSTTAAALTRTKTDLEAMTAEKVRASEEAATQTKRATELRADLERTRAERQAALDELAPFRTAGITAQDALNARKEVKRMQEALAAVQEENQMLALRLRQVGPQPEQVRLPAGLTGKVVVYDPKWHFVVLNVGAKAGMQERGELLVSRNGKLVGKVMVSRVEKDRAIGNVVSGWGAEVTEGDVVIPAYPES